ncbi:SMI1/KNR4 family protein [Luteolibacter luteus]|uniref:SMI1/KNR4 family protein n=1 Tax=Luteolibacter luteus TaxID=2728835 RepID=A0A858RDC6_9BACT|nr:SMI1/KNR4 family protein [Luteolibacter luteus]QJE94732.1 SMI1/KNR4 family protein [Luteolibacter luteus]
MSVSDIIRYVETHDRGLYRIFAQQGSEPSPAEISAFESEIGFALPDEFRELAIHPLGGLYISASEEVWPEPEPYSVGPMWSFLRGLLVYSLSSAAPDWLHMRSAWQEMKNAGAGDLVPFLKILGDADPYCFTPEGKIVIWRHEDPENPEAVDMSFSEAVMHEIRALEERTQRKIRGEDQQAPEGLTS